MELDIKLIPERKHLGDPKCVLKHLKKPHKTTKGEIDFGFLVTFESKEPRYLFQISLFVEYYQHFAINLNPISYHSKGKQSRI